MTRDPRDDQFAVAWAMADRAGTVTDPHLVVDRSTATCSPDPEARCPACGTHHMEAIVVAGGNSYDHCEDCGRLWALRDGQFELMVFAEVKDR